MPRLRRYSPTITSDEQPTIFQWSQGIDARASDLTRILIEHELRYRENYAAHIQDRRRQPSPQLLSSARHLVSSASALRAAIHQGHGIQSPALKRAETTLKTVIDPNAQLDLRPTSR